MARVNVYLPDELAQRARSAGLNVSAVAQAALEDELAGAAMDAWLSEHGPRLGRGVPHTGVLAAVREAKDEVSGGRVE